MRKIQVFNNVTLDGYFTGKDGDFSWAHAGNDAEFDAFVQDNASGGGTLLFGRKTYEIMASYWPTPSAAQNMPEVAENMNRMSKLVFSNSLPQADWSNTRVLKGDPVTAVRRIKEETGDPITILGSGMLIATLAQARLIDEFQVVVNPVILGEGRTMFAGAQDSLKLEQSRTFKNGKVWLRYTPRSR